MTLDLLDRHADTGDQHAGTDTGLPSPPEACTTDPTPARYPHRQSLSAWLDAQAAVLSPAERLLRALPLVEAVWSGPERLALHVALWSLWREVDNATRAAARAQLDGRHALWCRLFDQPWQAGTTWETLAQAHLAWPRQRISREEALSAPHAPDYVETLLAHHAADATPVGRWWRLGAALQSEPEADLDPALAADLGDEALAIAEAGGIDGQAGLALLFELAVRCGDADRATAILTQCVAVGGAEQVAAHCLRRWLEGPGDALRRPLALTAPIEATWLRPARLDDPDWLNALAGALRRPGPATRVQALAAGLGLALSPQPPADPAWKLLSALDGAYALAEAGRLSETAVTALRSTGRLAPAALAALAGDLARQHAAGGDVTSAARELAHAREQDASPVWRASLAELLATIDAPRTAAVCEALRTPATEPHLRRAQELQAWQALADDPDAPPPLRAMAQAMLARAALNGRLEVADTERHTDLPQALQRWSALADDPAHAEEARTQLAGPALRWHAAWHADGPGRTHLFVPPRGPANGEWLLVPSCLDSRHTFTQVDALVRALPGHHLVFVNNPEFNWYSDAVFDGLRTLVRERVLRHTPPERVSCYFGSMGGTAALKLALEFGLRAVVFNPQTDLDLWAAFRPREHDRLWAAVRDAAPDAWPDAAWARAPMYLACGSGTADRLALTALIARWRGLRNAHLIVEKFIDPDHAGLLRRVTPGPVTAVVQAAACRLAQLRDGAAQGDAWPEQAAFTEIHADRHAAFWDLLDADATLKTEIVLRAGRLFLRASDRCATR